MISAASVDDVEGGKVPLRSSRTPVLKLFMK